MDDLTYLRNIIYQIILFWDKSICVSTSPIDTTHGITIILQGSGRFWMDILSEISLLIRHREALGDRSTI